MKNFGVVFSIALFFIVYGYSLILKLYHIKKIDDERKGIIKSTLIMNIVFVPGFILDFYLLQSGYYSLFIPIFYFCSSVLFLNYFIKKHNAELTTIQSINNTQGFSEYLEKVGISKREKEIITLIMKGYSNRKIANQLFISLSTVKTHIKNIFQKLKVESRFEIITKLSSTK
jgi:DNA-binding CsgD family transcriptional regulator